jgi:hypothetical protein
VLQPSAAVALPDVGSGRRLLFIVATLRASLNGLPLPAITLAADLENPQATVSESAVTILAGRPRCPPLRGI